MHTVTGEQVHRLLGFEGLVEALKRAHAGPKPLVERSAIHFHKDAATRQSFLNLPAWLPGQAMGIKCITVMPGNETAHDLPTVHAVYLLFDGETGEPSAAIDGTQLTLRKTAADSALGASLLAHESVASMLMVGAGAMAPHLVRAHLAVRPSIAEVTVWNRSAEKAERLVAALGEDGIAATRAHDLEAAVRSADLVCCATSATEPIVSGAWLKPGSHIDLVGSFTTDMRESDDEAVRRAEIYVDSRWFAVHGPGDLAQPLEAGVITEGEIRADLFEMCTGEFVPERGADTITLFKNAGGAHLDLFTALYLVAQLESGAGPA